MASASAFVPPPVEKQITLTLSEDEAEVLYSILNFVGDSGMNTSYYGTLNVKEADRGIVSDIFSALYDLNYDESLGLGGQRLEGL